MKHICYLTGLESRYDVIIFERHGSSLSKNGFKVTIVCCDLLPDESIDGIEIVSCRFQPKNRIIRMLNTKKYLYEKIKHCKADIYEISEPELIPLANKLKKEGYNVVFNMRENYTAIVKEKEYIPKLFRNIISRILGLYMKISLKKLNAVFTVTPDLVNLLKDKWKIENTYLLTNYPIINKNYTLTCEEYFARPNVLCYIGTIYRKSRQEIVFKALQKTPEISYLIAGVIDEGYIDTIAKQSYWKKVSFINGFNKTMLPSIFAQATISNVLRDYSNSGTPNGSLGIIKLFESMEAALPIICSDVPVNRQIIEKYNCGICVDPNNVDHIEDALKYLIENKDVAFQMGQNGRRAVIEEYNWESQEKFYIEVFKYNLKF